MKVFTYYAPVKGIDPEEQRKLIALWEQTWRQFGWEPIVLTQRDAIAEDATMYRIIRQSKELGRGPFPEDYGYACHHRWLAHKAHGGLMTDYDVMNFGGFLPLDMERLLLIYGPSKPIFLAGNACPCAVWADKNACSELLLMILEQAMIPERGGELKTVCHDQAVFASRESELRMVKPAACLNYDQDDRCCPLIHFAHVCTPERRSEVIERALA